MMTLIVIVNHLCGGGLRWHQVMLGGTSCEGELIRISTAYFYW